MFCVVCRSHEAVVGLICENCRDDLATPLGLLPHQLSATIVTQSGDALIDQWGRAHPLEERTLVGRALEGFGMALMEGSVSRHHAHLSRDAEGWKLRDLDSSNGTYLNEVPVVGMVPVQHGDRIAFGSVGFYLVRGLGDVPAVSVDPKYINAIRSLHDLASSEPQETRAPQRESYAREKTLAGLPVIPLRLAEPTGGGGGLLELGSVAVQLSTNQIQLLSILSKRMIEEADQSPQIRGFVRTAELLSALSWDTREPDESHVKQLIRRLRRLLIREGLGDLIESRHRFGYRLRLIPSDRGGGSE